MSALPCSSILPWLENGLSPFGLLTLTCVLLSSLSRSTHSICKPSFREQAFLVGDQFRQPWNGAVVSRTSFFMGGLRDQNWIRFRDKLDHIAGGVGAIVATLHCARAAIMLRSMKAAKGLNLLYFQCHRERPAMPYNILILGAAYGSLLASKMLFGGHKIHHICLPAEADLINAEGFRVRLPVKGRKDPVVLDSRSSPAR